MKKNLRKLYTDERRFYVKRAFSQMITRISRANLWKNRIMVNISVLICAIICLSLCLTGCEAFRKKFVRKPKREKEIKVVVHTQEYESIYSVEQVYKKYFLFWRAAHEELINSLNVPDGNRKKRLFAAEKIVENLQQMRQLLVPEKQNILDSYISEQENIARQLNQYKLNHAQKLRLKNTLKKQKRQIQKEFTYKYVQEYLVKE